MSKTVNRVILLGNVSRDPDIRTTPSGTVVANFSIATNERQKDRDGKWTDRSVFHALSAFSKTAEVVRNYVVKGSKVFIEGRLDVDKWQDKATGQNRERTKIVVDSLVLLDAKQSAQPEDDLLFEETFPA